MSPSRRNLIIAGSATVLMIAVALVWRRNTEPVFQGRTLSYWVDDYSRAVPFEHSAAQRERAAVAIRQIGSSAVPFLLGWMDYEKSAWRENLSKTVRKWDLPFKNDLLFDWREERAEEAAWVFRCLGSAGNSAIPELVRLLNSTNARSSIRAGVALGSIGSDSVPVLLNVFTNAVGGSQKQNAVIFAWLQLGTNARPAAPILLQLLNGADQGMAANAALLFRLAPVEPDLVIPSLSASLDSSNSQLRCRSIQALSAFDKEAHAMVLDLILRALKDPDLAVRKTATNAVRDIAPEVFWGTPTKK